MCISNQRECARFNPPLVCCALNLLAFVIVLFTVGAYITHYPVNQGSKAGAENDIGFV